MNDIITIDPLSDDPAENLDRFIVEAMELGCVWGLEGPDGWALSGSEAHDDVDVKTFWRDYKPVAVELVEFLEDWLPGLHEDVLLVGINWNDALEGEELEPLDLLEEFEAEMGE